MKQLRITKSITNRETPSLDKYLNEIGKVDLLNSDQEVELSEKIRKGDTDALERLVKANLRFVVSVAKQYQNQGLSLSDLINEGNIGLMKAALKFDATKGFKFISYAVWWIRQSIMQSIMQNARLVRLPLNKITTYNQLKKVIREFEQENERKPHIEELQDILDLDMDTIDELIHMSSRHVSLEAPVNDDEENINLLDVLNDHSSDKIDKGLMHLSMLEDVKQALTVLPERDASIIASYYGLNNEEKRTLEEIGIHFGLTRERVRQIKERSLRRLRKASKSRKLRVYLG